MPTEEKQLTAMQVLYNRNQEIIDKLENTTDPCQYEYCKALISVNDDIDTELLATERQQLIGTAHVMYLNGTTKYPITAEQYFNQTFKTQ